MTNPYQNASDYLVIRELAERVAEKQTRIDELEEWIAAIADDHPQIPAWVQQSASSLLAQGE